MSSISGILLAAAAWPSNSTSYPIVQPALHDTVVQLVTAAVGGLVAVSGAIGAQIVRDRTREREQVRRAAATLGIELTAIARSIRRTDWIRPGTSGLYERRAVPRSAYDGIANSGVLSKFDLQAQELLYRFYWCASIGDHDGMNAMIGQVAVAVRRVRLENAPGLRTGIGRAFGRVPKGGGEEEGAGGGSGSAPGVRGQDGDRGQEVDRTPIRWSGP